MAFKIVLGNLNITRLLKIVRKYFLVKYFYMVQVTKNIAFYVLFCLYHIAYVYSSYVTTVQ
jgi:hypothetical protein